MSMMSNRTSYLLATIHRYSSSARPCLGLEELSVQKTDSEAALRVTPDGRIDKGWEVGIPARAAACAVAISGILCNIIISICLPWKAGLFSVA